MYDFIWSKIKCWGKRISLSLWLIIYYSRSERWSVWGLENGLTTFTEHIEKYLRDRGVEIYTDYNIRNIKVR